MGLDFFGGGIMSAEDTVISLTPIFILGLSYLLLKVGKLLYIHEKWEMFNMPL